MLVTEKGIGECAAAVWHAMKQQRIPHVAGVVPPVPAHSKEERCIPIPASESMASAHQYVPSRRAEQLAFTF